MFIKFLLKYALSSLRVFEAIRLLFLFLSCWLFSHTLLALPSDYDAPLQVISDTVSINYAHNITTLHGHVKITQGSTELEGATVIVYSDEKQQLIKLIAYGDAEKQAKYSTLPEENKNIFIATANKITYLNQEKLAIFEGNAHATDGHNHFQGPNFSYWMDKQEVITEKSPHQHATILIVPKSSVST